MIIRNRPTTPRRGNEPLALGIALGSRRWDNRPTGAKALKENNAFAPSGRGQPCTLPRVLPWAMCLMPLQGKLKKLSKYLLTSINL